MSDVDYEAVQDSNRALSIIFIIGIFCVNVALMLKIWRKNNRFFYNAKHQTLISLAIGDVFLALFSLILTAKLSFEPLSVRDVGCSTKMSASIYSSFLLPFVYGVGLCVLAFEVSMRQRITSSSSTSGVQAQENLAKALVFSGLPWFLGLVIVLPLTMAGMNWDDYVCTYTSLTLSRGKAMFWVSIIVPACLAFVACFLIMFMKSSYQPAQPVALAPVPPTTIITTTTSAPPPACPDSSDASKNYSQQPPAVNTTPGYNHYQYPPQTAGYQYPPHGLNQVPQYGPPQYPNQVNYPPSQPQAYQGGGFNTAQGYVPQSQPVNSAASVPDPSREKNILLWAAIILFICVIPDAGFNLGYNLNVDRDNLDQLTLTVITMIFTWLKIFRSLITPILWLGSASL